jgi:hypothetical protein
MRAESPAVLNTKPAEELVNTSQGAGVARRLGLLFLSSLCAILVHGYHPSVEDAEIYVPGIKKLLNPALYPYNQAFFASHASMTFYPNLIAWWSRLSYLPLEWTLLLWHFGCIFLLLCGCWRIGRICFVSDRAAWGGSLLVAALLTIPVAGTALYIMDQYVNPRSISTATAVWIIASALERKYWYAAIWIVLTALVHPLMAVFSLGFVLLLIARQLLTEPRTLAAFVFPLALFPPVNSAYKQTLNAHSYFFVLRWEWFEWLGAIAPLFLFWWFARIAQRRKLYALRQLCFATIGFGIVCTLAALVITIPSSLIRFAELQPMRGLLIVYLLLFVVAGGLLAEYLLKGRAWRWVALFIPICAGMFYAQRQLFPATAHLELPGRASENPWLDAFLWIRDNTPVDAYFALNPEHMRLSGEDQHGFRAVAERSMLADAVKDSGAVTMFPALAQEWRTQVEAEKGWDHFGPSDFERLRNQFGITWVVVNNGQMAGLDCPYRNWLLAVCRIPGAPQSPHDR